MRQRSLRRGWWLAVFTVVWNIVEGVVAVAAGTVSGSVALIGFGIDSFVETASAVVVGWRLRTELTGRSAARAEEVERTASRIAGSLLLLLAAYILFVAPLPTEVPMALATSLAPMPQVMNNPKITAIAMKLAPCAAMISIGPNLSC